MAQPIRLRATAALNVVLALLLAGGLAACSRQPLIDQGLTAGGGTGGAGPLQRPSGSDMSYEEEPPEAPEPDPAEGPVNLPPIPTAPAQPVEPGAMQVRALATTLTAMPIPGMGAFKAIVIRAKLTWTPVKGASGYRVFQREGAEGDGKGKLAYTTPRWVPAAIVGGGMGFANLKVGQEYVYTIEAVDKAGNVIATGQDHCAPLPPLEIPYLVSPGQNESKIGATPYFKWNPSRGADGYYVEVFGTIRNSIPAVPMWRAFRSDGEAINILYGSQVDVFPGTRPIQWSLPLNVGSRYAWTVCALRTDSHDMHNAKAIAKATAPFSYFLP